MRTLFPQTFNWAFFILAAILVRVLFMDLSWFSFFVLIFALYQFILLFNCIGYVIPTRHLLGSFMCVQFFVGPALAYSGLDQYQYFAYKMAIPEAEYFGYAIPAVLLFILGLHINAGIYKGEVVDQKKIEFFYQKNPRLPYVFIGVGFLASVASSFFGSGLAFVFYLMGSLKFIGLFILILGARQIKTGPLVLVIGSIISSSLGNGMFHDLLTWIIFGAAIFGIKYKFDFKVKMIGLSIFIFVAITIQVLKGSYREATGVQGAAAGAETFTELYQEKSEKGGIFNFTNLAQSNVRINQGFIITNIMATVPEKEPFANGEQMKEILEAAIMPRFLAPNKLRAGDRSIFVKYSRIGITQGTSMGLSSVGDAYINFGVFGGCIFMFFLGLLYSETLNIFSRNAMHYPVLILFVPLVFYYPIRPDCELQTILGHLFKSVIVVVALINIWKPVFYFPRRLSIDVNQ